MPTKNLIWCLWRMKRACFVIESVGTWTPLGLLQVGAILLRSRVGDLAEGAGVALGDIDGNGRPELVLMAYDSPEGLNSFRYRIGWNINPGAVTDNWTGEIVPGVSEVAEGAGIDVVDLDGDGVPEIVLMGTQKQKGN
jgi:hypothetical protein